MPTRSALNILRGKRQRGVRKTRTLCVILLPLCDLHQGFPSGVVVGQFDFHMLRAKSAVGPPLIAADRKLERLQRGCANPFDRPQTKRNPNAGTDLA